MFLRRIYFWTLMKLFSADSRKVRALMRFGMHLLCIQYFPIIAIKNASVVKRFSVKITANLSYSIYGQIKLSPYRRDNYNSALCSFEITTCTGHKLIFIHPRFHATRDSQGAFLYLPRL